MSFAEFWLTRRFIWARVMICDHRNFDCMNPPISNTKGTQWTKLVVQNSYNIHLSYFFGLFCFVFCFYLSDVKPSPPSATRVSKPFNPNIQSEEQPKLIILQIFHDLSLECHLSHHLEPYSSPSHPLFSSLPNSSMMD